MRIWFILTSLVCLLTCSGCSGAKKEMTGTLHTGIFAIGGETTGVELETTDGTFELDFGKNQELREKADKLSGKSVVVTGALERRSGIEIKERKIIMVTRLEEAKDK